MLGPMISEKTISKNNITEETGFSTTKNDSTHNSSFEPTASF